MDKDNPTQFGRAMRQLGIGMIPAYSPEARGRSERAFATHQGRLPRELALAGITGMEEANRYLREEYLPAFNQEFAQPAQEEGSAFVPFTGSSLDDILCEQFERTVGKDNCVKFDGLTLQIPGDRHRHHYVKAKVRVHRYGDGSLALFHGPRKLVYYDAQGQERKPDSGRRVNPLRDGHAQGDSFGLRPPLSPCAKHKSGQSMCYRTGQFYLLLRIWSKTISLN